MSNAGISWERGEVEAITLNADGTKSLSMRGSDQTLGGYDQIATGRTSCCRRALTRTLTLSVILTLTLNIGRTSCCRRGLALV